LVERLGCGSMNVSRPAIRRKLRRPADLLSEIGGHPAKIAAQKSRQGMTLAVVQHPQQNTELDTVGMRLDFTRLGRQALHGAPVLFNVAVRGLVNGGAV